MIAVGRARLAGPCGRAVSRKLPPQRLDLLVEPASAGLVSALDPAASIAFERSAAARALLLRAPSRRAASSRALVGPVAAIDAGEDGLQAVIVALRDRVELVVVAPGAVDGQADEGGHGVGRPCRRGRAAGS